MEEGRLARPREPRNESQGSGVKMQGVLPIQLSPIQEPSSKPAFLAQKVEKGCYRSQEPPLKVAGDRESDNNRPPCNGGSLEREPPSYFGTCFPFCKMGTTVAPTHCMVSRIEPLLWGLA